MQATVIISPTLTTSLMIILHLSSSPRAAIGMMCSLLQTSSMPIPSCLTRRRSAARSFSSILSKLFWRMRHYLRRSIVSLSVTIRPIRPSWPFPVSLKDSLCVFASNRDCFLLRLASILCQKLYILTSRHPMVWFSFLQIPV